MEASIAEDLGFEYQECDLEDFDWETKPEGFDDNAKLLMQMQVWAKKHLEPVTPQYCICWEKPGRGNFAVTVPAPAWLSMALHGNMLPHVETQKRIKVQWTHPDGRSEITNLKKSFPKPWEGKVINGWLYHAGPRQGPMTEEEAMEYLVQVVLPEEVWQDQGSNRRKFVICRPSNLPGDRLFRNAWTMNQGEL